MGQVHAQVGHPAVHMGQSHRPQSLLSHEGEVLPGEEVEPVHVLRIIGDGELTLGLLKAHHRLHEDALPLLNVLAHGVQVGGKLHAGGEDALAVLAFALAVELLPPLGEEAEGGLVAGQQLHLLAALIQGVAGGGVLPGGVVLSALGQGLHGLGSAGHQGVGVDTGHGDG